MIETGIEPPPASERERGISQASSQIGSGVTHEEVTVAAALDTGEQAQISIRADESWDLMSNWSAIKKIVMFALPLSGARFITMGGNFGYATMMARYSRDTFSASGLIFSTQLLYFTTSSCMLATTNNMVAETIKENERLHIPLADVGYIFRRSMLLATIISVPSIVLSEFTGDILRATGQSATLSAITQDFFNGYVWGILPGMYLSSMQQLAQGAGRPRAVFISTIANTAMNVGFAYLFIYGGGAFPRLGAIGLGYANTLSTVITLGGFTIYLFTNKTFKNFDLFKRYHGNKTKILGKLARSGIPIGIQFGSELLSFEICTLMIGAFGNDALAAQQSTNQCLLIFVAGIFSLSQAASTKISQAIGAAFYVGARKLGFAAIELSTGITVVAAIAFCAMPEVLSMPFMDVTDKDNAKIIALAKPLFMINSAGLLFDSARNILAGNLRSYGGDTLASMLSSILGLCVLGLPLGYVLSTFLDLGINGVIIARGIGMVVGAGILFKRWFTKSNDAIDNQVVVVANPAPTSEHHEGIFTRVYNSCTSFFSRRHAAPREQQIAVQINTAPSEVASLLEAQASTGKIDYLALGSG